MKQKVLETIKKYNLIQNGDKIVLGVSGGPDSISMLDILNEIRIDKTNNLDFNIVVAHVNHMIREEAGEDLEFVKNFCNKIGVEFYSKSIDIQKIANTDKIGTEEAGRNARYEFFDEILEKGIIPLPLLQGRERIGFPRLLFRRKHSASLNPVRIKIQTVRAWCLQQLQYR